LPDFEQPSDFEAIEIFKQEGLTVIPILSKDLPEKALGNIHCITMTYPPVPMRGTLEN
jgi:hypothetical protein